ncbi:MAG: MoxR family ATPase [Anaerolineales bacterium]
MAIERSELRMVSTFSNQILDEIEKAVIGKRRPLEIILTAILSGGHILIEDFPGLGKTLIAKSIATTLGLDFKRIQFTPDLLPTDITGGYIYDRSKSEFMLRRGPIFANIVLADEINRASPKTQSALLEAMQEGQVTLEGETAMLPNPFVVMGTQNPIEYEGTFPLPEAQLDRFIVKVEIGYPTRAEEIEILDRRHIRQEDQVNLAQITTPDQLLALQKVIEKVHVSPDIERYIVSLVHETRTYKEIAVGASPRGSLALLKLTRSWAAMQGRDHVLPDDVKKFATPALVHRLILKPDLWLEPKAANKIILDLLGSVPVPVMEAPVKA